MNYALIFKLLSFILGIVAAALGLCLAISFVYDVDPVDARTHEAWIASIVVAVLLSLIFFIPGRYASKKLFRKEAICVVGLGWILSSLMGALPYVLIADCGFFDAFFESASGFSSTGATVFAKVEEMPHSLLFWRSLTQWIGGLGVVVFFVALVSSLGGGSKVLYSRESTLDNEALERGRLKSGIWRVFRVYAVLSLACVLCYWAGGMSVFDAVCHMFSTVSTGGFSTKDAGFEYFDSLKLEWIAILFMLIGGTSFAVILMFLGREWNKVGKNSEFKAYIAILAILIIPIFFAITDFSTWNASGIFDSFTNSVFQVVSLTTSTGFNSSDYQVWPAFTHILLFFVFVTGACSGSTSGGLKIFRALGVLKISIRDIEKSFRPNVIRPLRMNGRAVSDDAARNMLSFVVLYAIIAMAGILILAIFEQNMSFGGCVFTVVSAISNIGPGLNETGPTHTYAFMTDGSKFLLGTLMVMGRLEFYAVLALFMPSLWKQFK